MSRYLERAESVARLLDMSFQLEMDLAGLLHSDTAPPWEAVVAVLQQTPPESVQTAVYPSAAIAEWLSFDINNPPSILSCVNRSRNNARGIRGRLSSDVWRALNSLYWKLRDSEFIAAARLSPHDYFQAVQNGSHQFQGVCDATMPHDEGWQFIQLGKYLERADKTLRILEVKYRSLCALGENADRPLVALEWAGVLKSCLAYEGYQRLYISRVEAERVIQFLLLDPASPRSVRFCLEQAGYAHAAIEGGRPGDDPTSRALGRVISDLRYAELGQLLQGDFIAFLTNLIQRCNLVSRAIQQQYSLVA
jgi:uncharacterized alpha-E superfamily protein